AWRRRMEVSSRISWSRGGFSESWTGDCGSTPRPRVGGASWYGRNGNAGIWVSATENQPGRGPGSPRSGGADAASPESVPWREEATVAKAVRALAGLLVILGTGVCGLADEPAGDATPLRIVVLGDSTVCD